METKVIIETAKYYGVEARLILSDEQLIFFTKPKWVRYIFGMIGHAIASDKERFRIDLDSVKSIEFSQTFTKRPMCKIIFGENKDYCYISVSKNDEMVGVLEKKLKDRIVK